MSTGFHIQFESVLLSDVCVETKEHSIRTLSFPLFNCWTDKYSRLFPLLNWVLLHSHDSFFFNGFLIEFDWKLNCYKSFFQKSVFTKMISIQFSFLFSSIFAFSLNFSSSANLIPLWSPLSKLTIHHYHTNLQILFKTQFCNRARALTSRPSNPLRRVRTPRRTVPPFRSIPISGIPLSQRRFSFSLLFAFAGSTSIEMPQNGTTPSTPSASEPSSLLLVHTSTLRRSITTAFRDSTRHFGSATFL